MRNVWSLVAQTSGARIYWVVATLLTTVITARYLGPHDRGVFVAAVSWVTMFSTFGFLSLSQVIIYMAVGKKPEEWLPRVLGSLLAILGIIAMLGWFIAFALYAVTHGRVFNHLDPVILLLAFAALPFMLWVENGNGILMAIGRLPVMNVAQVIGATATCVLTLIAVSFLRFGVHGALIAVLIAQATTVAISLGYIAKRVSVLRIDRGAVRELLTGGAKLHLNAIGAFLFTQANVLIINYFRSPKETAYYQLAVQLVAGLQIIPLAVSSVTYSLISQYGADQAWPQQRKLLAQVVVLVIVLGVIGYFVAPWVIQLIFGTDFLPAVPVFRVLLWGVAGMAMSIVMASQWIGRGLFLQAALLTLMVGTLTVVGNYLVVPRYGMFGAAWITVVTYGVSVIGNGIMALWVQNRWRRFKQASEAAMR